MPAVGFGDIRMQSIYRGWGGEANNVVTVPGVPACISTAGAIRNELKETIIPINSFIKTTNKDNNMYTPYLDIAIQKYYKDGKYRYFLSRPHNGVHGGEGVKIIWGRLLKEIIQKSRANFINRAIQRTLMRKGRTRDQGKMKR